LLYIDWDPTVWGLRSRAADFRSANPFTCALNRLGAYNLNALQSILDLPKHLPVLYTDWGPTIWWPTVWGYRLWICHRTNLCFTYTGGLQPGGLQSRSTEFGSARALTRALHRLGAYSLGVYSDLLQHLPVLYIDRGPTISGYQIWICCNSCLCIAIVSGCQVWTCYNSYLGVAYTGGIQSGGLQSRATRFGSVTTHSRLCFT